MCLPLRASLRKNYCKFKICSVEPKDTRRFYGDKLKIIPISLPFFVHFLDWLILEHECERQYLPGKLSRV